jgi:hypothetical protein
MRKPHRSGSIPSSEEPVTCRVCRGQVGMDVGTCTCPTIAPRGWVGDGLFPDEDNVLYPAAAEALLRGER